MHEKNEVLKVRYMLKEGIIQMDYVCPLVIADGGERKNYSSLCTHTLSEHDRIVRAKVCFKVLVPELGVS